MEKVKHIYFDVGGVLIIDFTSNHGWRNLISDLGFTKDNYDQFDSIWKQHAERACLDYDIDNLIPYYEQFLQKRFNSGYSLLIDIVSRCKKNHYIQQLLDILENRYKLGLLTNMYPRMLNAIIEYKIFPTTHWDNIVDSSTICMQKPDLEIYLFAQEQTQVDPSNILFIDNLSENLIIPKKLGWQTFHYNSAQPKSSSCKLLELLS